jgi:putative chitinase
MIMLTPQQLIHIMPPCKDVADTYAPLLTAAMDKWHITTPQQQAAFIAQAGHESGYLLHTTENLNYSAEALRKLFPSHFPNGDEDDYARNPERIANRIYANRMGNGDEASGDGWNFRGGGLIQLTGKTNYTQYFKDSNPTGTPDDVRQPLGACDSAGWFWSYHHLNNYVDANNFVGLTKAINGGTLGLEDRQKLYASAQGVITV